MLRSLTHSARCGEIYVYLESLTLCRSLFRSRFVNFFSQLLAADGKYCLTGGHDRTVRLWNPLRLDPAFPPPVRDAFAGKGGSDVERRAALQLRDIPRALPIQTYRDAITSDVTALGRFSL